MTVGAEIRKYHRHTAPAQRAIVIIKVIIIMPNVVIIAVINNHRHQPPSAITWLPHHNPKTFPLPPGIQQADPSSPSVESPPSVGRLTHGHPE
jgi:hypothetical protein